METTAMPGQVTLHEQSCHALDLATLLAEGRVSDFGESESTQSALNSVLTTFHQVNTCHACCPVATAEHEIAKIDIRQFVQAGLPKFSKSPLAVSLEDRSIPARVASFRDAKKSSALKPARIRDAVKTQVTGSLP